MLTGGSVQAVAPWRLKLQAVLVIAVGVISLISAVALTYFNFRNADLQSAYRGATACASPSDALAGEDCRYTGDATVTGSSIQTLLSINVRFEGLSGRTFTATFATGREPDAASVSRGAHVTGVLWNGHVTRLAGEATTDDPAFLPGNFLLAAAVFAVGSLLAFFWGAQFARKAWS